MEKTFWVSIKENKFVFPDGYSIDSLTEELIAYIGSTDPELRDSIGLEAFYHWLKQGLYSADDLRGFITRLLTNLQQNIGSTDSNTVFLRSFSALWLANIVSHDNEIKVFEQDDIHQILDAALAYFEGEHDCRGYVPVKGWVHAIAHSADLLNALVISLHTNAHHHLKILDCIAHKLRDSSLSIFRYNEDSRIAQPALWIFIRGTLPLDQIEAWVSSLTSKWNGAWQNEDQTRAYNNGRNFLRALYWYTSMKGCNAIPNQETVLKLLQTGIENAKPWEW